MERAVKVRPAIFCSSQTDLLLLFTISSLLEGEAKDHKRAKGRETTTKEAKNPLTKNLRLEAKCMDAVKVKVGATLFLYDVDQHKLHGVFEATSDGSMNIIPDAYVSSGKPYPCQDFKVPVTQKNTVHSTKLVLRRKMNAIHQW
ncbi:hypothetical protein E2562_003607 [Oryza meyeriana var. granulata]|uniref:DCD domain-containing protein n=1 Tax=Oryza meyeriana var. granulata TaxID=110450 RepID=A0A6G1CNC6_9ORYZ|nr:hypothetical protein E2562_003607 [Oryza meyeriana var. granulata]